MQVIVSIGSKVVWTDRSGISRYEAMFNDTTIVTANFFDISR